jgi:hypothetical protein
MRCQVIAVDTFLFESELKNASLFESVDSDGDSLFEGEGES